MITAAKAKIKNQTANFSIVIDSNLRINPNETRKKKNMEMLNNSIWLIRSLRSSNIRKKIDSAYKYWDGLSNRKMSE